MDRRSGLAITVVDILVAGLCLVVLGSLSMPLLLKMRSDARVTSCTDKLRAFSLAVHHFHDSRRRLPPATLGMHGAFEKKEWAEDSSSKNYWKNFQNTNWLFLVSVFSEFEGAQTRYNKIPPIAFDVYSGLPDYTDSRGNPIYSWQGEYGNGNEVMQEKVDAFLCSEDNLGEQDKLRAVIATQTCVPFEQEKPGSRDNCRDIAIQYWPEGNNRPALTNFVANIGVYGQAWASKDEEHKKWRGAMSSREKVIFEDIGDGTSRTILLGESLGEIIDGQRKNGMSWMWGGAARITGNIAFGDVFDDEDMSIKWYGDDSNSSGVGFGSKHEDLLFSRCDGSVFKMDPAIDVQVLHELAGAHDGGVPKGYEVK